MSPSRLTLMRGELGGWEKSGHVEKEPQVRGPVMTPTFSRKESHCLATVILHSLSSSVFIPAGKVNTNK